uniref:Retrovirus-related Pol polyprotein from transposon TNT 1-94 n=1 Tax=Triticum urartu TaxID=4572 RepID=A0A8R7U2N5_TRIUA
MRGGTGGSMEITPTTTLFRRLTRGTTGAIIVVIQATSGQNAPRGGSRTAKGIIFTRMTAARGINPLKLQGFTDADWQGDLDDRKSTSGYLFTLAGGAISWSRKKQDSVALSSMEAEYIAASEAVKEGVWLKEFLASLVVVESTSYPVTIFYDNQAAIKVSKDPKFHSKTKHIEGRYHYICDVVNRLRTVRLDYLPSVDMVADPLTKPLSQEVFCKHVCNMGVRLWN